MLIGERMSYPVITVPKDMPINEALTLMRREKIRRLPVTENGKLVGIVSDVDLLNASPSPATSLSIWEMNYLLSKITVKDVMTKQVLTVNEDTPVEEGARMMADNKIGGLPVVRGQEVVGIITETDLFKIFLELMGAREMGTRLTILVDNVPGQLAKIANAVASEGGNIFAAGSFLGDDPSNRELTIKVSGISEEKLVEKVKPFISKIIDVRTC
ncbi:MAG: CBS domain-containing protein [Chloroflexi bacterium]|nr:MAG: CBS domain-containing protein [Chloroflexota bacterium]